MIHWLQIPERASASCGVMEGAEQSEGPEGEAEVEDPVARPAQIRPRKKPS